MGSFALAVMAAQVLVLAALFLLGQRHVRGGDGPEAMPAGKAPRAAVIVPLTGDAPGMREAIASLLDQDYPDFTVIFVTAREDDPAVSLVREVTVRDDRAMHVLAGPAEACGQKNHNILAGIRAAATAEVFVFCDSTHRAGDRRFVTNLVAPIARGDAAMTSGFHKIVPEDFRTGTLGMLMTCMALHLMQPVRAITQPWGGAMAISRQAFDRFGLRKLWGANIVDDFSMGPYLHRFGVAAWPVASACLETPLAGMTLARWDVWLTRQLLYLKFCIPPGWLASIVAVFVLSAPPVMAAGILLGWLGGWAGNGLAMGTLLYVAAFLGLSLLYRRLSPRPVPLLPWLRGYVATFLMLAWSFGRTFTTNTMSWRGIDYRVGWGGVVQRIIRTR